MFTAFEPDNIVYKDRGFEVVRSDMLKSYDSQNDVILPKRGTSKSAGYDFFMNGYDIIKPGCTFVVWTDIKAYMKYDEVLEIYPRSSMAIKKGLVIKNTVGIIDSDYYSNASNDGNIGIALYNSGNDDIHLNLGDAIAQGIFKNYLVADNCNSDEKRAGGMGSTNK